MSAWAEVEKWKAAKRTQWATRTIELLRLGWVLLPSDDGKWWARKAIPADRDFEEVAELYENDPVPDLREHSWEVLLAEVKLRTGRKAGAA